MKQNKNVQIVHSQKFSVRTVPCFVKDKMAIIAKSAPCSEWLPRLPIQQRVADLADLETQ